MSNLAMQFVRFWSANMVWSYQMSGGANWPGFFYSPDDRRRMKEFAQTVSPGEFRSFLAYSTVFVLALLVLYGGATFLVVFRVTGGRADETTVGLFMGWLVQLVIAGLCLVIPVGLLLSAALVGRRFRVQAPEVKELLTQDAVRYFFRRAWFQIARVGLIAAIALPLMIVFIPAPLADFLGGVVLPFVETALAVCLLVVYLARRA